MLPASPSLNEECKFHFYKARVRRFRVIILSVIVGIVFVGVVIDMLAAFTCPCVGWNGRPLVRIDDDPKEDR